MPGILIRKAEYRGEVTDLLIDGGAVTPAPSIVPSDVETIAARGLLAMPGLVDVHVHFRDPGFTEKEDILTGARAAAAGGVTTVLCEPNTRPVIDTPEAVSIFYARVARLGIPIAVYTKAAISYGERGEELTDFAALAAARVAAFSDDGEPFVHRDLLVEAFRMSPLVLTAHCEETPKSAEKVRAALGDGPAMAREVELIRLHIEAVERAGTGRLHIQHVSLADSLPLIAGAKRRGLKVTAEVTPHHLLLCEDEISQDADANWKMNPPLRSRVDMLAMRCALADGVIDMIATDHAPHTTAEKAMGWAQASFGIIGLETALGACLSLVHDGTLTMNRLIEATSTNPAKLLPEWAQQRQSDDLVLLDSHAEWTVDPEKFYSKARNCPFAGMRFQGKPVYTIANGTVVMADGDVRF